MAHNTHLANCSRHIGRKSVKDTITNTSLPRNYQHKIEAHNSNSTYEAKA